MNDFELKCQAANAYIEEVDNWIFCLDGVEWLPKSKVNFKTFKDENLIVMCRTELHGLGKIYKRVIFTSDKYHVDELPKEKIQQAMSVFYAPEGQDSMNPLGYALENCIVTKARYWPRDTYVKELVEKRNFMSLSEFIVWSDIIDDVHSKVGVKTPSFIKKRPFVTVQ